MTYFPDYLKTYPNMHTSSPLHISLNRLDNGFRPHKHDFLEFSYVISGSGAERVNGDQHVMKPGTFTFVLPYQVHQLFTDPGESLMLYNCMFSMDLLMESAKEDGLLGLIDAFELPSFLQLSGEQNARMLGLIEELFREYSGNEPWRKTMLQVKLKEILIAFDRLRLEAAQATIPIKPTQRKNVWPIISYIHANYQDDLTLSDLSAAFAMSVSRISEVIKETTGQNFVHLLHDLRLRHACGLLVSTDMSVAEIALEVGYGSYKTFSRIFHEKKGVVPKDYRKQKPVGEFVP
ncbi:AraC family transcriptional regulator [Paenibacillus radicis (ex Gao et al. 2016)]|uniref:HTH araC/xylS-type domain-containing protein n=1 Tax=Paenibacillus radicis (ex Gao et al. 2016) TaxID=1737354 RepID=A0A917HQ69_9BACL|nr:AraC family transcriptional regulator [Paenibacillus radicis (ex Gao et al. 2016)]GGG85486.1 hypothetical protein GCM10010918_49340 [Paenibacillus radicis (ex Gao et al. 2016)]